jgi:hypothetical protein
MFFLAMICILILYQYFFKRRYGLWVTLKEEQFLGKSDRQVDDSLTWKVKFLNFGLLPEQKPITIPKGSKMISLFNGVSMVDIYDNKLNHIEHYYNPTILVHEEGKDLHYGVGYYFMLRYHSDLENTMEAMSFIQIESKPIKVDQSYEIGIKDYFDESDIHKEIKEAIKKVVTKMEQEYYSLDQIITSDLRRSFPTNMLINEMFLNLEPETRVIILATNKKKLFGLEHSVEFNSDQKPFVWNPEGDGNFCSLVLEGPEEPEEYDSEEDEEDDISITISEFLYCENSKILPIVGLIFMPDDENYKSSGVENYNIRHQV